MTLSDFFYYSQWLFLAYFLVMNGTYLLLNLSAIFNITRYMNEQSIVELPGASTDVMPPISLLVPAYNEELSIVHSVQALLQLDYPEYEIVVINDGSTDRTLEVLNQAFSLQPFPEAYRVRLQTKPVNNFFRSKLYPKIRVIDKQNGGKADSINAGINVARYPLFCTIDADSILQHNSLRRVVQPFLDDSRTVACGGTVRIVNGCKVSRGFFYQSGLPANWLALFQIVEYLRAFLFGRLGWSPLNALLIISGAFGLFHKETVVSAGGYHTDTVGEDMELVTRLHRYLSQNKRDYRIVFVPDPICWTEAPESLQILARQRIRWQRGLAESLLGNLSMLFNPRAGAAGLLAFPYMLIFELFGPLVEVIGYLIIIAGFMLDFIALDNFLLLLSVAIGLGILLSVTSLLMEEISFHIYQRPVELVRLFVATILENFGFRQLSTVWRMIGLMKYLFGTHREWGEMKRKVSWHQQK